MKKILSLFVLCCMAGTMPAVAQELYGALDNEGITFTIYYDTERESRGGYTNWMMESTVKNNTKTVVFDESVKDARPTSLWNFFKGFIALEQIVHLDYLNTSEVTTMSNMFYACSKLEELDLSSFNTDNVESMTYMFSYCRNLKKVNLANFNTSKVKDMEHMFDECNSLDTLDLDHFDLSAIKDANNLKYMFSQCANLKVIYCSKDWSAKGIDSNSMFIGCTSLQGHSGNRTFDYDSQENGSLYARPYLPKTGDEQKGYFSAPKKIAMYYGMDDLVYTGTLYYDDQYLLLGGHPDWFSDPALAVSNAKVKRVKFNDSMAAARPTSTASWFKDFSELREIDGLDKLNTSEVTDMSLMFTNCKKMEQLIAYFLDTRNVTNMSGIFINCESLRAVLLFNWNTEKVTDMSSMFYGCTSLENLDLSSFTIPALTNANYMFENCSALTQINCNEDWSARSASVGSYHMFSGCEKLIGGNGTTYDSEHTSLTYARPDTPEKKGYFTGKEIYSVYADETLTFCYGFYRRDAKGITDLLSHKQHFDEYKDLVKQIVFSKELYHEFEEVPLADLSLLFHDGDKALTAVKEIAFEDNLFDIEVPRSAKGLFAGMTALEKVDLLQFSTMNVTDISEMFKLCESLETIISRSDWSTWSVNSTDMFKGCVSLVGGQGTTYKAANPKDQTYAHVDGGTANPGYFTSDETQGLKSVQNSDVRSQKVLRDGQLYLIHEGKMYNVQGAQVR